MVKLGTSLRKSSLRRPDTLPISQSEWSKHNPEAIDKGSFPV